MYHKIKNTLMGFAAVAAFVIGGVAFSEPVPADLAQPQPSLEAQRVELAFTVARLALNLAQAEIMSEAGQEAIEGAQRAQAEAKARASRVKLELGMPYYSFGTVLTRRAES